MRLVFLVTLLFLLTACADDTISRRYDYSNASHDLGGVTLVVSMRGSEWRQSTVNEYQLSEWVGPYYLSVRTIQDKDSMEKLTVLAGEVGYFGGETIQIISKIQLKESIKTGRDTLEYYYGDAEGLELKYEPIRISLDVVYSSNGKTLTAKVTLVVNPDESSEFYNSTWAGIMSV